MADRTSNHAAGHAAASRLPCPPWCRHPHDGANRFVATHVGAAGRIPLRASEQEIVVYAVQSDARTNGGTWVRETATVHLTGYGFASPKLQRHEVNDLTLDEARALAWVLDATGSAELAGLLRQAAALLDEEAGR